MAFVYTNRTRNEAYMAMNTTDTDIIVRSGFAQVSITLVKVLEIITNTYRSSQRVPARSTWLFRRGTRLISKSAWSLHRTRVAPQRSVF